MQANLAQLLPRIARCLPEQPAVFHGATPYLNYRQLAERVRRTGHGLQSHFGLRRGDRVALLLRNCPEYVELLFAIWHAGLCAVPINAKLHPREVAHILEHSAARLCFIDADSAAELRAALDSHPVSLLSLDQAEFAGLADFSPIDPAAVDENDVAWLFYTSGTTGRPKGAMLSHRNLTAMSWSHGHSVGPVRPSHRLIHAAPMSHGSGLYILPYLAEGAAQVIPVSGGFDPAELVELIDLHRDARLFAAPTMLRRLVAHLEPNPAGRADIGPREVSANAAAPGTPRLPGLDAVICGGAPLYLDDLKAALACLGGRVAQIYGQGESPMTITAQSARQIADALAAGDTDYLASVGTPCPGIEIRIAASAGSANSPLPPGTVGEVLVRGATVMAGYLNDPAATAATLNGGWLATGDVGRLDANACLHLKDRSKDVIISGGSNIYPREVEEVLLCHPGVAEVAVLGRHHADWGEEVVAVVVAAGGQKLDPAELDAWCNTLIARFKRPKAYLQVSSLPKNSTGKVLKTELRRLLREEAS